MTATVALRAPGTSSNSHFDGALHRTVTTGPAPFAVDVPARVQALTERRGAGPAQDAADDMVRVAGYLVSLPLSGDGVDQIVVDGETNTLIDVTASSDPLLTGKTLRVADIVRGTNRFERDLLCTLND